MKKPKELKPDTLSYMPVKDLTLQQEQGQPLYINLLPLFLKTQRMLQEFLMLRERVTLTQE